MNDKIKKTVKYLEKVSSSTKFVSVFVNDKLITKGRLYDTPDEWRVDSLLNKDCRFLTRDVVKIYKDISGVSILLRGDTLIIGENNHE